MREGDLPSVAALLLDCNLVLERGLSDRLHHLLRTSPNCCVVALEDDQLVGVALAVFNGFHIFMSHIAVSPEHRGRGIGRAMHEELERIARRINASGILTDSWLGVTGFYHALGYRIPGAVFLVRDIRRDP